MRFALFILVNAVLFIRPAELIPELENAPIYEVVILAALVASWPAVLRQLSARGLRAQPATVCMLGLLVAVVLSQLWRSSSGAIAYGQLFLKIVLYYLLLVGVVDTPARLRQFLGWVGRLILALTTLALLQHHELIDIPALAALQQREIDPATGELRTFPRLCGMGIFSDPNDLSVILVVGMAISLSRLGGRGASRLLWAVPLVLMGYALTLTHSRGGFLALVAALSALLVAKFGLRKALIIVGPVLVGLVVVFGGRQTNFDLNNRDDTSQHRIRLWREGLLRLKQSPVFGIGTGRYEDETGLVAHNSFVHAYTELGLLGGTCFLAAFVYPIIVLYRLGRRPPPGVSPVLLDLWPCMLACVTGMVAGMLSLSRNYTLPPYLIVGVIAVYLRLIARQAPGRVPQLSSRMVGRFVLLSAAFLVGVDVFVRLFAGTG